MTLQSVSNNPRSHSDLSLPIGTILESTNFVLPLPPCSVITYMRMSPKVCCSFKRNISLTFENIQVLPKRVSIKGLKRRMYLVSILLTSEYVYDPIIRHTDYHHGCVLESSFASLNDDSFGLQYCFAFRLIMRH